jgi:hypothetical protein
MLASIKIVGEVLHNDDSGGSRVSTNLVFERRQGGWEAVGVRRDGKTTPPPPCFAPNAEVINALDRTFARVLRHETRTTEEEA